MRRFVVIAILLVCAVGSAVAGININTEAVKASVVFVYLGGSNGEVNESAPDATGFLVSVPTSGPTVGYYWLLVTARHVVDPKWDNCDEPNPDSIFLRLNMHAFDPAHDQTGVGYVKIDLTSSGKPLFAVGGDDADVAVIRLNPSQFDAAKYDVGTIPLSVFGTPDELKQLSIGDDLLTAGLMPMFPGLRRNYPIFKFGKISDVLDETVPLSCPKPTGPPRQIKAWLIAANSFPGSSGSPIFYVPAGANNISFGGGRAFVAGLQSNTFGAAGLGLADVAGMTPAAVIFDTIQSMNLPNADLYRGLPRNQH